ncbi:hypothetical protein ACIQ7N_01390 [Lysinibacillus sp. NPDC095746]|uniref:PD-(D/E)XK nuclease domain-containing protein n=1 Tax=Lysinibacillus sp. NPDC095746 TaxID=3364134 RepID=UPI0038139E2D
MNLLELIELGEVVKQQSMKTGLYNIPYISSPEYENWLTLSTRFLESNFPNDVDTIRFREIAQIANGEGNSEFFTLISILKAFEQIPPNPSIEKIVPLLSKIFINFNRFDVNIKRRYSNRDTIEINDEYDLQDSLLAIMKLFIDDVRPEDYVPSYAGKNSRVDFLLPEHKIVIETKMTSKSLSDKQIGEQLIIDFERYKQLPEYNHLICFVYDKGSYINNPHGLIKDLEKLSDSNMKVSVFISPL